MHFQIMTHGWRRTISLERHRAEEVRQTYIRLSSDMDQTPPRYGATVHDPQHAHAINPSAIPRLESGDSNSSVTEVIQVLDEILSELWALEVKCRLQPVSSTTEIPFLLRLKFTIEGKRKLKTTLGELQRHNDDLKAMVKDLREAVQYNLAISAQQTNSMNIELHPTSGHIATSQADGGLSTLRMEDLIDLSPSISLDAGDATAVLVHDPLQIPPLPTSGPTPSTASSPVSMSAGGVFESPASSISYEREDNYSIYKDKGDTICTQCHQMCRGARYP